MSNLGTITGGSAVCASEKPEDPALERLLKDFEHLHKGLEEESQRLCAVATRLYGSYPQEASQPGNPTSDASYADRLRAVHTGMAERLGDIREAINHLERAV